MLAGEVKWGRVFHPSHSLPPPPGIQRPPHSPFLLPTSTGKVCQRPSRPLSSLPPFLNPSLPPPLSPSILQTATIAWTLCTGEAYSCRAVNNCVLPPLILQFLQTTIEWTLRAFVCRRGLSAEPSRPLSCPPSSPTAKI